MNPDVGIILGRSAQRLAQGVAEQGQAFAQGTISLIGLMLSLSANEYERGADIRVAENAELRSLLGACASHVVDRSLQSALEQAAQSKDGSLRISVLNEANYTLRRLVTELLIEAEDRHDADTQRAIWAVLKAGAERRFVTLG